MKRFAAALIILSFTCLLLVGCEKNLSYQGFGYMGTFYSIKAKGSLSQKQTEEMLSDIENALSTQGEISKINAAKSGEEVVLSNTAFSVLRWAYDFCLSDDNQGALDISLYPIVRLWGLDSSFTEFSDLTPPTSEAIEQTLCYVGLHHFTLNDSRHSVIKDIDEAGLDLGAIGKGYAVSALLSSSGFSSAIFNLGGTIGAKGDSYKIGVQSPLTDSSYFCTFQLPDGAVCSTSGDYQRYFTYNNKVYHHIFAADGYPVSTSLTAVTVVCKDGKIADALSTCCFSLGEEKSKALLDAYQASAIFVYHNGEVSAYKLEINITDKEYTLK